MAVQPVAQLQSEPVVGETYLVPAIFGYVSHFSRWWPIIGPEHEDTEHIGVDIVHRHIDWRFVSDGVIHAVDPFRAGPGVVDRVQSRLLTLKNQYSAVELKPMRCRRPMPKFPLRHPWKDEPTPWGRPLERAYAGRKARRDHFGCRVCPHKGMPLNTLPEKDGVVVCPGHGLAFRVDTGELVPRYCTAAATRPRTLHPTHSTTTPEKEPDHAHR